MTLSYFFSAQHFATKEMIHAVQVSAFCRSKVCWSFGGLDTIVVVSSTSNKNFFYFNNWIRNGLNVQKFTGIYSPYQYENLQIRLYINKLIWVILHLSFVTFFSFCRIWQVLVQFFALNTLFSLPENM